MRHILENLYFSIPVVTVSTVFPYAGCGCYRRHNSGLQDFASGVVKRSTFFAERLFHIRIVTESTIQKILLWLLYLTLFKNPTQNCDCRFCAKYFFALLLPAHCSAAHSPVVRQRTAGLESTAQFCCNFRHSYTLFLNIYKYSLKFPKTKRIFPARKKKCAECYNN